MKLTRITLAAVVAASMTAGAFAAVSKDYADFATGPAKFLFTKDEQTKWKAVKTDEEAKAFIDLFWARRDPTPGTPINEFREEFDAKVKVADERFASGRTRGALTDRAKIFIILGSPSRIQRTDTAPGNTIQQGTGSTVPSDRDSATGAAGAASAAAGDTPTIQSYSPKMVWFYDQAKLPNLQLGAPTVDVAFIDQYGSNEWKLERTPTTDVVGLLNRINQSYIKQPELTVAPAYNAPATSSVVPMPTPVAATPMPIEPPKEAGVGTFKTDALKAAVDEARAGKAAAPKNLFVSYGEFVTPGGESFVPVSLYVPKSAGLSADAKLTFYGQVENANGEPVAIYEEPATLTASKNDFYFDKSLKLAPGKYKGTFGLAQDGKPIATLSTDMNVTALDKDAPAVSRLILSNNIYALSAAQNATDPYAFGGLKVVPKSDRTFSTNDDLWYFFELRNPGIDAATNAPKLLVKLGVKGKATTGQNVKFDSPAAEMAAQELKGVPGHYAVGASIPLTTFRPGDYTMTVKVTDQVKNQTYDLDGSFKVVAAPEK